MSLKEYNFAEFTDKDMFEMRLAATIPDFGYIACTKRKPFLDFCVEYGFLKPYTDVNDREMTLCDVLIAFRFTGMLDYRPQPIILAPEYSAIICKSFKIRNLRKADGL